MDEITEMMGNSGAISNSMESSKPVSYRSTQYKIKSGFDQRQRRDKLLNLQKGHRKDIVNKLRQLDDDDWQAFNSGLIDADNSMESESEVCTTNASKNRNRHVYKDQLMLSEWMIDMPADFETQWIMVPSPVGRRCLIVAKDGSTYMYTKSGYCYNKFPSKLPGGCRHGNKRGPRSGVTLIDCICNEVNKTCYVLDVICWNGHPFIDSETDFRFFWMHSKLQEFADVQVYSRLNPFVFHLLPSFDCKKDTLQTAMVQDFDFEVDGLLFYHRQAHYLCSSTPLVLWLKPYMLPEVLNIEVNTKYKEEMPSSYSGFKSHLSLVQSDTTIAQKHQDLYTSPEGRHSKAERLVKHQAKNFTSPGTAPIIQDAQFKYNQTATRNIHLGLVEASADSINTDKADTTGSSTTTGTPGFKFGDAPSLQHMHNNPLNSPGLTTHVREIQVADDASMEGEAQSETISPSFDKVTFSSMSVMDEQSNDTNSSQQQDGQWTEFR